MCEFNCVFKKTVNNYFLTLINEKGNVVVAVSLGDIKIKTKKRKDLHLFFRDLVKYYVQCLREKKILLLNKIIFNSKFR